MRISRAWLVCFLVIGLSMSPFGLPSAGAVDPPLELEEVGDGIYSVRRKFVGSNAAVIITDRDVIVVDTHASPAGARGTLAGIREIRDRPVRYVVNTHWHTDHFVGNQAYLDAFSEQVEFISHETVRQDIDDQGRTVQELETQPFVIPDLTLQRALTLHRGEREIRILFLGRGHTRGDVVVYPPQEKTVIAGDLLTHPTLHVGDSSRPVEWLASLRALADLDFEVIVPGHGEVVRGREYLELIIGLLEQVVDHVQTGLDQGLKFAEIESQLSLEGVYGQWVGDDRDRGLIFEEAKEFVPDALGRTYLELTGRLD